MISGRRIVGAIVVGILLLAFFDVLDVHFCKGRLCIAPAGHCHVCEQVAL